MQKAATYYSCIKLGNSFSLITEETELVCVVVNSLNRENPAQTSLCDSWNHRSGRKRSSVEVYESDAKCSCKVRTSNSTRPYMENCKHGNFFERLRENTSPNVGLKEYFFLCFNSSASALSMNRSREYFCSQFFLIRRKRKQAFTRTVAPFSIVTNTCSHLPRYSAHTAIELRATASHKFSPA